MLQAQLIGNIGGNAEIKSTDGREFVAFRVAHNESYNDANGTKVTRTMWVDCTMNCDGGRPAVLPYLTAGTLVYVTGAISTRVYNSEKDRCMKAGITIRIARVELLGGQSDLVPKRLIDKDGLMYDVAKYYNVNAKNQIMTDTRGHQFNVDKQGWVTPVQSEQDGDTKA